MTKKSVILLENVSKTYPLYHHIQGGLKNFLLRLPKALKSTIETKFEALSNISLSIQQGETFGIIGKNGAGKSTMLGLMAGVLKPTSGRLMIDGRISPLLELGGGFHLELSGMENIMLNGVLLGMTRAEVKKRIGEIIEFSGLSDFIDQPIRTYSSGMLARLGFSVIVHLDPEIFLIDEILGVGDMSFQKKCLEKMMGFKTKGVTMVFVSHSISEIEKICDRVCWIENHCVKMIGSVSEVVPAYSATMND